MAVGQNFFEGTAIGVLNNIISAFHSNEGYAQPNRYEVNLFGPRGRKLGGASQLQNVSMGTESLLNARNISLRCESVTLPGINLSTAQDTNIYGPTKDVVEGVTYAEEVTMSFQASSDLECWVMSLDSYVPEAIKVFEQFHESDGRKLKMPMTLFPRLNYQLELDDSPLLEPELILRY